MADFKKFAKQLVDEIPLTRLEVFIRARELSPRPDWGGLVCGGGCTHGAGSICGSNCNPTIAEKAVIDREGYLGLTAKDYTDICNDLPKLRQAVIEKVEANLNQFRP